MKSETKSLTLMAVFTALIVAVGYALIQIPNVELVTATAFLAGTVLGIKRGFIVGAVGELLYAIINPFGISALSLLISQVIGIAMAGAAGGVAIAMISQNSSVLKRAIIFSVSGVIVTIFFDVFTTLGFLVMSGLTWHTFIGAYMYGISFYVTHVIVNAIIFALLIPVLYQVVVKYPLLKYSQINH